MTKHSMLVAIILGGALLAGCFSHADPVTPLSTFAPAATSSYTWPAPLVLDGNGSAVASPQLLQNGTLMVGVQQLVPGHGGEPNIGITSKGNVYVTTNDYVRKSSDQGRTWKIVEELRTPGAPVTEDQFSTADPMLWVDPLTDRIYADQMLGTTCTWLSWSDDEGATWTERPFDCATPFNDHQKVMTARPGPSAAPTPMLVYPDVVYMCINKGIEPLPDAVPNAPTLGTTCQVSLNGGLSFQYEVPVTQADDQCGNLNGHPASWPDGTVGLVLGGFGVSTTCKRPVTVGITENNGVTWELRSCAKGTGNLEADGDLTITPDGTAYLLYRDHDQLIHLLRSKDKFRTCDKFRISPPGMTISALDAITSGDDGRIAMAYLGTYDQQVDSSGNPRVDTGPSNATEGTRWQLYVTTSFNAEDPNPTFVTQQATPNEDPVQIGCVWQGGGQGGPYACRNLLDFIDMTHDADGRWYVVFTDGCTPRMGCAGNPDAAGFQTRDSQVSVLVEDHGASLFAKNGSLPPLGLTPPTPLQEEQANPST